MEYNFSKICRACLKEGIMMSVFKVNVFKKLMACASIQVWQNDGLPEQICNKCMAKLHISFQFKKQCERSEAKLKQYISQKNSQQWHHSLEPVQNLNASTQTDLDIDQSEETNNINRIESNVNQPLPDISQNNCAYLEGPSLIDMSHEQKYEFVSQTQQPLNQMNYNVQSNFQLNNYNMQNMVYNGTFVTPLQTLHSTNVQVPVNQMQATAPEQQLTSVLPSSSLSQPQLSQSNENNDKNKIKKENTRNEKEYSKQCPTCYKSFATTVRLNRHMKTHSFEMPYKCQVCGKGFTHSGNYKIHLRMHTDERPFRCTVCDKGCRQAQDLEKHMRTHTGERPHKCNMCTKAFTTSSNLIAHIRTHTGERPYVCCVCQKAFCQSNELTKHMRTHTGEKSHICDICNKGFNGSSTLIVHRRSHTGERPYVCSICNKGFTQSSCLTVHMKRHSSERSFQCLTCEKTFKTNCDLKDHHLTHTATVYVCHVCDKTFDRALELKNHSLVHKELRAQNKIQQV